MSRPWEVVVSTQLSAKERKLAPRFVRTSRIFRSDRVDRAKRSRRLTTKVSPEPIVASNRLSSASALPTRSWMIVWQPARFNASIWAYQAASHPARCRALPTMVMPRFITAAAYAGIFCMNRWRRTDYPFHCRM